jgi:hypothetical protein
MEVKVLRVLQYYRFRVGRKIPFDKWPGIVEVFLKEQGLSHRYFHYWMESFDFSEKYRAVLDGSKCQSCQAHRESSCERCKKEAADGLRKGTGCERAVRENPFLAPMVTWNTRYDRMRALHNYDDEGNDAKAQIYGILPKLYRRYGFTETRLIYRDIDFFGHRLPSPKPVADRPLEGYMASGITLYRSCLGENNAIILVVEAQYPGDVPDANLYADALGAKLPGVKRLCGTEIVMEEPDEKRYSELAALVAPKVCAAKAFFEEAMPKHRNDDEPESSPNVAAVLKRLCKRYGYQYVGYDYYIYFAQKKLPGGHYVCVELESSPTFPAADPGVSLYGLGFRHEIWSDIFRPQNAGVTSDYLNAFFQTLARAEETVFAEILKEYSDTPDWYLPVH